MKLMKGIVLALLLAPVLAQAGSEDFKVVSMKEVPERVARTATSAKRGSYISKIIQQQVNDQLTYNFYASQVGRYWVIVVRDDGELIDLYESPSPPPNLARTRSGD